MHRFLGESHGGELHLVLSEGVGKVRSVVGWGMHGCGTRFVRRRLTVKQRSARLCDGLVWVSWQLG